MGQTVQKLFFVLLFPLFLCQPCQADQSAPAQAPEQKTFIFYSGVHPPMWDILEARLVEAFSLLGLKAQLVQTESSQRALLLANDTGDGDAMRVPNIKKVSPEQTGNLLQIQEPILKDSFLVYTKNHNFAIQGYESLKKYNNGFRRGAKILEKNVPGQRTILPTVDRLFHMLAAGRIDTVIEWELIADKMLKTKKIQGIHKLSPPLLTVSLHTYMHKKHAALIPRVSKIFQQMRDDGTFQQIRRKVMEK